METTDVLGKRILYVWLKDKKPELSIPEEFLGGEAKDAYKWAQDYRKEYDGWPTPSQIEENLGITLPEETAPFEYLSDQIRKRNLGVDIEKSLRATIAELDKRDPDTALDMMSKSVRYFRDKIKKSGVVSFRDTGLDIVKEYRKLKSCDGLLGFPTPWERLNSNIQGWVDGTLNVVTAMQNTGKTWFLCHCANHAYGLGKKALFISLEMDTPRILRRLHATRFKIPFRELRSCEMDDVGEARWEERIKREASLKGSDIILADKKTVRTVDHAYDLVDAVNPDIVFIDGGYRFQGSGKRGAWEESSKIVAELQLAAEFSNIPWVVTTQQGDAQETGKEKKRGKKIHAWGVRYAKEWVINPDNVIGLYADEDLRLLKSLEIHTLKMRDSTGDRLYPDFLIKWDLSTMEFGEFVPISEEESEVTETSHEVTIR